MMAVAASDSTAQAVPTASMLACLRRLHVTNGRLSRRTSPPSGWQVITQDGVFYWFPTSCGNGLVNRGLVDENGYINRFGKEYL